MKKISISIIGSVLLSAFFFLLVCTNASTEHNLQLEGIYFTNELPETYTCNGASIVPGFTWTGTPANTQSFAITMHRELPNGDKEVSMVQYGLSGDLTTLPIDARQLGTWGINSRNDKNSYAAPCPSQKQPKEYIITLYALSKPPSIRPSNTNITKAELELAIQPITITKTTLNIVVMPSKTIDPLVLA